MSRFTDSTAAEGFFSAYDRVLAKWPLPIDTIDVESDCGTTRVNACGPVDGRPVVLLPGGGATSTVWFANVAALARENRVFAIDPMGDPGRSVVGTKPIRTAAARLFWRHGFSGTSTRALTTATGLSTSSLYAAFGSKAGLFEETVRTYTAEYRDIYTRAVDLDSIAAVIESILTDSVVEFTAPSETHPGCFVSSAVTNDSADTMDAAEYVAELHRTNERTLITRIERAIAEGEVPVETSAQAIAGVVQAVWHGLSVQSRNAVPQHALISTAKLAASSIVAFCRTANRERAEAPPLT